MLMRIVFGLLIIVFSSFLIIKTEFFYGLTGAMDWPEQHIGPGGTRLFLKLIGLAFIFGALLYMTGTLTDIGHAVLTPTIPAS